ncbi:hypothetical protein GR160_02805 [Flavobacterium sp. Sd200]|uniref:hypothetical protein n=1 Tax=Flavobacterium sp. Sd200 TaxID=2692211 RepID=UPI00136C6186|nr:hypothetical protein [Flavobacterium sp. Sd200]MXN90143.1 hypothetical protein [Flavobacterium sp. Sd200]
MKTKYVVAIGTVGLVALGIYLYNKARQFKKVFDNMRVWPSGIRNIRVQLPYLLFNLDITLQNPTDVPFSITGASLVTLRRVVVYRNGKFLGQAEVNLAGLEIPAFGTTVVRDLPFRFELVNVLDNLINAESLTVNDLTLSAVVEVFGQQYEIEG